MFVLPAITAALAGASVSGANAAALKKPEVQRAATPTPLRANAAKAPGSIERTQHDPLVGIVSLARQRISIWQGDRLLATSPI